MANNRIKGITVEIGGDTTGLSKALESVNKQIKSTQAQLKDVDKLLKLDPGNTDLLVQKQELLNKAVEETKSRLETLKIAAAQANEALSKGEISKDQYDALQREIFETEEALKSLEKQANSSSVALDKIAATGEKLKTAGDSISSVGKSLAPVSAAVTGVGVAGVKAATDWQSAFTGVKKTVDATEAEYEQLAKGIQKMATETASSMEDIAGVAEVAGQLGIAKDKIIDFTKVMVELGDTTNISAEEAATSLARFLNITGESTDNISKLGSAIVDLGNNFATDEASIVAMSTRLASAGTLAGLTSTDILALSTAMSSVGIQAEAGGTAMTQTLNAIETAVVNFKNGSTESLEAIAKVANVSAEDFAKTWNDKPIVAIQQFIKGLGELDEKGESATLVLDDLGMKGIRQANMLKSLALASDVLSDAVDTSTNAYRENVALSEEASKRYETFESQLSQLKESLKTISIDIGMTLIPILQQLMEGLKGLVTWWTSLSDGQRKLIVDIGIFVAALSPVLIIVGKLITAVGTIMTVIPKIVGILAPLKAALSSLFAIMAANPITIVIAAIAALIAAFAYLWNHCEGFRQFWIDLWNDLKNTFTNIVEGIKTGIASFLNAVANMWQGIKSTVGNIKNTIVSGIGSAVSYIKGLASQAFSWGADIINGIVNGIKSCISKVGSAVKSVASTIKSYLHFSVPDEGPLTDFESWMPDFMEGLAKGIRSGKGLIEKAMDEVACDMVINPQSSSLALAGNGSLSSSITANASILNPILDAISSLKGSDEQNIVIPVYIGQERIDEIVVNASKRANYRSGGR